MTFKKTARSFYGEWFLNLWVPDLDVVSSILNMWDAASCAEIDKLRVDIKNEFINENNFRS